MSQNDSPNEELTTKQYDAIQALIVSPDISKAAEVAGVNRRSIYRWMGDTAFKEELARQRKTATDGLLSQLTAQIPEAVSTLVDLMKNAKNENIRMSAAKEVLSLSFQIAEIPEIRDRLSILEKKERRREVHWVNQYHSIRAKYGGISAGS